MNHRKLEISELKNQGPFEIGQLVRVWGGGPVGVVTKLGMFNHPENKGVLGENVYWVLILGLDLEVIHSESVLERY